MKTEGTKPTGADKKCKLPRRVLGHTVIELVRWCLSLHNTRIRLFNLNVEGDVETAVIETSVDNLHW